MSKELSYIAAVFDESIVINCNDKTKYAFLKKIGAKRKFLFGIKWRIHYKADADLAIYFAKLRDNGFFFSYDQHGWGPSDIFQYLRKNVLLKGDFTEIFWRGPNITGTRKI
jgi:hypothetical protein